MHVQLTLPFTPPQLLHGTLAGVEWCLSVSNVTNSDVHEGAPMSNIWVGQKIWFESEIFATGKNVEKVLGGGQTNGVK